jgi:integrase
MGVKIIEIPKESAIYYLRVNYKGFRKTIKIGTNKKLAGEVKQKIEARLVLEGADFLKPCEALKIPTLKEYVYGWRDENEQYQIGWFDKNAKKSRKYSTYSGYESIINTHLIPKFGTMRLDEITSRMVSDYVSNKLDGHKSQTVKNLKNCLSAILQHAYIPDGHISLNPCRGVVVPKPEKEKLQAMEEGVEPDPYTWAERAAVEQVFRDHFPRFYPLVLTGFRTGLRIGELLALQWPNVSFDTKLISVRKNISRGRRTTPKSRSSIRDVRMTSLLLQDLEEHRETLEKEAVLKEGKLPSWVFPNKLGRRLNYGNFMDRVWNKAMEMTELRRRTPHDMRHTYATLRLLRGHTLAEVSKEMGHASVEITFRTYFKWLPKESHSNIDELDGEDEAKKRKPDANEDTQQNDRQAVSA